MTDSEDRRLDRLLENMDLLRKETGQQFAALQKAGDERFEAVTKQIDTSLSILRSWMNASPSWGLASFTWTRTSSRY